MKRRIAILGFGTTGKACYQALKDRYQVYIYDENAEISENLRLTQDRYGEVDYCIKSPGIHPDQEIIRQLEDRKIPIYSDLEVFQKLLDKKIYTIAVTGTNGKTTTSLAIHHILKEAGKRVFLAGNIGRGVFDLMGLLQDEDYLVLECSSFQLKYIQDFHPNIAIITNISQDHLDWHHTVEDYQASKKKITKNQRPEDLCLVNRDDPVAYQTPSLARRESVSSCQEADAYLKDGQMIIHGQVLGPTSNFQLVGDHNMTNLAFALLAAEEVGLPIQDAFRYGASFKAVDHRLQFVAKIDGVAYYNDSKGTNPDSTDVALASFPGHITLIAGGYDKGSSFLPLLEKHKGKISQLIVMGQTKDRWIQEAQEVGLESIHPVSSMEEAVKKAKDLTKEGVVLLSPACASWGAYKNYEERGRDFMDQVKKLEEE